MPSRSTNLNAPSNVAKKVKPDKRKRAADAAAAAEAEAQAAKRTKVEETVTAGESTGEASGSRGAAAAAGEGEVAGEPVAKVAKVVEPPKPTKVNGEYLPSKEDIEQDKEISEGAKLGE